MKKCIILVIIIVIIFAIGIMYIANNSNIEEHLIGGDTDDYGCLIGAGYLYDKNIGACTRNWELNENQKEAAKLAIDYLDVKGNATIINVAVAKCPGCFVVDVILHSNNETVQVSLANWEVVDNLDGEKNGLSPQECEAQGGRTLNIVGGTTCDANETNIGDVIGFISPNICCVPN